MKNDTIKAIKLLEETSSTKDKVSIIQDNRFNSEFLKLLEATYNDSQYGFSNKKLRESLENFTPTQETTLASRLGITNIFELCSCLANNNINAIVETSDLVAIRNNMNLNRKYRNRNLLCSYLNTPSPSRISLRPRRRILRSDRS